MPKLWSQTIEAHRREVRDAILETTAELMADHGLRHVTMSQIAEHTGIGRGTLYKYFADVDAILIAWHDRQVTAHLEHLAVVRDQVTDPGQRLEAVLAAYAHIAYEIAHREHGQEFVAFLHRDDYVARAQQQLHILIRDVVADAVKTRATRDDYSPDELASYCRNALNAAGNLPSETAVQRLVRLTLAALQPR